MTDCAACEEPLGEFRDETSQREASTSSLCQGCQDAYFGPEIEKNASNQSGGSFDKVAAVEEFPAAEEAVEEAPAEPRLPDWITDSYV